MITAGPWRRCFARVVDFFLLFVPACLLLHAFISAENLYRDPLWFAIDFIYFSFFESSKLQATPGEYLLKIKVTSLSESRLSFWQASGRFLCRFFPMIIFLCAMVLFIIVLGLFSCLVFYFLSFAPHNIDQIFSGFFSFFVLIISLPLFLISFFCLEFVRLCSKGRQSVCDYFSNTLMVVNIR